RIVEPPRAPARRQRVVGALQSDGRPDELSGRAQSARAAAGLQGQPPPHVPARPPVLKATLRKTIPDYAWTDITYLLHKHDVSWRYYVFEGTEPDCRDDAAVTCAPVPQDAKTPGIWNPLPYFSTVRDNGQLGNIISIDKFFKDARRGKLPAVSWIIPTGEVSEHPPALVSAGQAYV